jgi:cation diffusion facilitator family transporter
MDIKIKFGITAIFIVIFQSILKLIGVLITGSLSFLSETIDTLIDIFFVSLTFYSIYLSQKPADYEHMYGHSKIDSIGALTQGIILTIIYLFLAYNAIRVLIAQNIVVDNPTLGLQLLIISMVVNLLFSIILILQGKKSKSLSLKIQGLNLFQDSLRAIIVIINFLIVVFFEIKLLDPIFGIIISCIIIISALRLVKDGIDDLTDINPLNPTQIKMITEGIFNLEHVNGITDLRIRGAGNRLFFEMNLAIEDHISITHANEISKSIRKIAEHYIPNYDVETIIEMNPLSSERSLGKQIINLINSLKADYPKIIDIKNLNIFKIEQNYVVSFTIVVNNNLTLRGAHDISTKFELQLKGQIPEISRIISHIEAEQVDLESILDDKICQKINSNDLEEKKEKIEEILRTKEYVKGYHGFEYWNIKNYCVIEVHVFFDGEINISKIHNYVSELEDIINKNIEIANLNNIIIHSEPLVGRTDGIIF